MRTILRILERASGRMRVHPRRAALLAALAIAAGLYACTSDSPSGPDSECALSVTSLDFGPIIVGESAEKTFTITNNGDETISGAIAIDASSGAGPFLVTIGGGPFELVPAQQRTVVVRFTPSAPGPASGSVSVGAGCSDVACSGSGDDEAVCIVSTDTLDFGDVPVGDQATLDVTITNAGGSRITGTASEDCADFDLVLGASPYDLRAGDSLTIRVRFTPPELGERECFLETGSDSCADVIVIGTGAPPPVCDLSAGALDFGSVPAGESATRSVTITNTGAGTLGGVLGLSGTCAEFSIVGSPEFSLGPAESHEAVVRFAPTTEGPERICTLAFGTFRCAEVMLTGTGGPPAVCVVTPPELGFGEILIGESATLPFTIENEGQGTLAGTVAAPCDGFEIVGNASFSLTAGQSQGFTLRFAPISEGAAVCTLSVEDPRCVVVIARGAGVPPPSCLLSPATLSFGVVDVGETTDRVLTITNTGGGNVSGTVSVAGSANAGASRGGRRATSATLQCDAFTIVGNPSYSLDADESDSVVVRFAPLEEGAVECAIETGSPLCADPTATGEGFLAPLCEIEPPSLSFGTIGVGQNVDRTLTIRNAGGSVLAGTVTEVCDVFSVVGDGGYSLTAGQSRIVTLRFAPTAEGEVGCTIETGAEICADVSASGTGTLFSACSLSVSSLEFGTVTVGESADLPFTITNTGNVSLDGTVGVGGEAGCGAFAVVGAADYNLVPLQTATFKVRFAPSAEGNALCTIDTGDQCVDISASGVGFLAAACSLSVASLDFDSVTVGAADSLTFSIKNVGGSTLAGTVSESCSEFAIVGTPTYALTANQTQTFTVQFAPGDGGLSTCTIQTGAAECADLGASGVGELPPACDVSPGSLAFSPISVGNSDTLTFSITNSGGGMLGGTVALSCADFSLLGQATYLLGANASQDFSVRFAPSMPGAASCGIDLGADLCDTLMATGSGLGAAQCSLSVASVNFGTVTVGACDSATVTVFNIGGQTLTGEATESCSDYVIFSGAGAFQLAPDSSKAIRVRFAPGTTGLKNCTLNLGVNCSSVPLSGTGGIPPSCALSPNPLNFPTVRVNSADTLSFTITNTGQAVLTGSATESCSHFRIISDSSFTLDANESKQMKVQFRPTSPGSKSCTIAVTGRLSNACDGPGSDLCGNVSCTGTGAALSCASSVAPLINATCINGSCHPNNGIDLSCANIRLVYVRTDVPSLSPILLFPSGQNSHGPFGNGAVEPAWDDNPPGSSYLTVLQWITEGANQ